MCTVESHNEIAHSECLKYSEANYTQVHYTVKVTGNIKITIKYYTNLYTRDITYVYKGLGLLCPLCTSYKMVSNPVDYANACDQPPVFLAPSQDKSNLLWLLAETPLILEPLLIYGMQMHHLQSILRCEKVIGRPCVLPCNWMICINYYSLCSS